MPSLSMSRSQQRINGFSGKGSRRQRLCRHILDVGHRVFQEQMMGECEAAISTQRGQSAVNGGRSRAVIALTSHAPVAQVFMPRQRRIEGPLPDAFPPGREMGEVLADDLQCCGCATLRVQERQILLNRRMHVLSFLAGGRPSLLFYHSHTDSATCASTEEGR